MEIVLAKEILDANAQIARDNGRRLAAAGVFTVNVLGSPGAGKTSCLEAILPGLKEKLRPAVIEGDLATSRDAERIEAIGVPSIQINTEGGCHLDARMVAGVLDSLDLAQLDLLFIENVGNLICTAGFDLGEKLRVVVLSVTEGDDKVEKYPPMFRRADAVLLNKCDLLPYTDFDEKKAAADLQRLAPDAELLKLSAHTGEGIENAARWLTERRNAWLAKRK